MRTIRWTGRRTRCRKFTNSVAHGIAVDIDAGTLSLSEPTRFLANADLTAGVIDLNNLAKADSYIHKNDMLSISGDDLSAR
jgi:hypothetical protein